MSGKRYTDEFKIEAVRMMTDGDYGVKEVADRLGVTTKSLYDWKAKLRLVRINTLFQHSE